MKYWELEKLVDPEIRNVLKINFEEVTLQQLRY